MIASPFDFDYGIVIPVRGGSARIPKKNLLPFGGCASLLEWKIQQLSEIFSKSRIYVSTEDPELKDIAKSCDVQVLDRAQKLASGNEVSLHEVIAGIVQDLPHTHVAWCQVTSPLMLPVEYEQCFMSYAEHVFSGENDSLLGVQRVKEYFWDDNGPINYLKNFQHIPTQDLAPLYHVTNSIFMAPKKDMISNRYYIGQRPYKQLLSKLAAIDIDEMEDYEVACAAYPLYIRKKDSPQAEEG